MANAFHYFMFIIMVQLFYSFGISALAYAIDPMLPSSNVVNQYTDVGSDLSDVSSQFEGSVRSQLDIPLVDLGSLVFYSGNIIVDLILNFAFAVPSMVTLLIGAFNMFFLVDPFIMGQFKLFIFAIISILYFIAIIGFILNVRSRGSVV